MKTDIAKEILKVLRMEAATLRRVQDAVGSDYISAVKWMSLCKGKIILTGVGKSGMVAQKIASTLASTGTPALYLHPSEAMHGGLGLVQRGDILLAIGKSGESDELTALLPHIRSNGAKLISITANPKSTLAKESDWVLETPIKEEACPFNLAPTCSTTAALAVGDALAVALMKLRKFKEGQFAKNHPGGRLGKRLNLKVSDIMRAGPDNPVVPATETISRMLVEITRQRAGAVSIIDKSGRLVGLVTDYDIRKMLERGKDVRHLTIRQVMNPQPTSIAATDSAAKAIAVMETRKQPFNVLPVVDHKRRAVGMIQVHDLRARGL